MHGVLEVNFQGRPLVTEKVAYQAADGGDGVLGVLAAGAEGGIGYLVDVVGGGVSGDQLQRVALCQTLT